MKGVQCYGLFGVIALKNHVFRAVVPNLFIAADRSTFENFTATRGRDSLYSRML